MKGIIMSKILFSKVHGLGNDFILIDARSAELRNYCELAPALCHRHTGIGADGLLLVLNSDCADIRMRIINSDGSEAEMCGNGIRAFSKYVFENSIVTKQSLSVETLAGIVHPKVILDPNGAVNGVCVDMGEPIWDCKSIPVVGTDTFLNQELTVWDKSFRVSSVLVGVPHTVVPVDDLDSIDVDKYGAAIEHASIFPRKTNVNFVQVLDRNNIRVRTWERGCGRTLCCGTGSSSTVAVCARNGLTDRTVNVQVELGCLHIDWRENNHLFMTGPAETVFSGEIEI